MKALNLRTHPETSPSFEQIRARTLELVDYMAKAGKTPPQIHLFPRDHHRLLKHANDRIKKAARTADRIENADRKRLGRKDKVKTPVELFDAVVVDAIPVVSRARQVEP